MKHRISFYLTYACILLFGTLGVLLLVFGEKEPRASQTENRMLAGFPTFSAESVGSGAFMSGLESYLSDGVPARDAIVVETAVWMNALSLEQDVNTDEELYAAIEAFSEEDETEDLPTEAPEDTPEPSEAPETPAEADSETPQPDAAATDAPAPTEAPASENSVRDCAFRVTMKNGRVETLYTFPKENVQNAVNVLNAYRAVLPENGHVFFTQSPYPGIGFDLQSGRVIEWDCDVEETIQQNVLPGVEIVSTFETLKEPLRRGEDLFFTTDHHWKPRAACYVAQAMLERIGIHPLPYDGYAYYHLDGFYGAKYTSHPELKKTHKGDTIDVMIPQLPVTGYTIAWDGTEKLCPFMLKQANYVSYIGGTLGPWRCYETGVDSGRRCLVVGDSFLCAFVPYLTPYYDEVHTTDFRVAYYDAKHACWTLTDYVRDHAIDDIYIILGTANSINAGYMLNFLNRYL